MIGTIHPVSFISVWRIHMNCIRSYCGNDWQERLKRNGGIRHIVRSWQNVCRMWNSLKQNTLNSWLRSFSTFLSTKTVLLGYSFYVKSSSFCLMKCQCTKWLPPPKKEVMFLVRSVCLFVCLSACLSVCLSVCPSDYSQTCEWILTKFFGGVGHGSRTKWYNFGGDPDHASDPGVQSPKSGSA